MDLIRCSKFAELCGTTRDTLLHYESLGLLRPAFVDPQTNYRYYSATQFNRYASIKALVDAGLSLTSTYDLLEERSMDSMQSAIVAGERAIAKKIEDLQRSATILSVMQKQLDFGLDFPVGEPVVRRFDKRYALFVEGFKTGTVRSYVEDPSLNELYVRSFSALRELSPTAWLAPYGLTAQGSVDEPVKYNGLFFLIESKADRECLKELTTIPAGEYACLCFQGPWDDVSPAHRALMDYVSSLGSDPNAERLEISVFRLFDTDSSNGMHEYRCIVSMLLK